MLSLPILEMFITAVNALGKSPAELVQEKEDHDEFGMGEYENFLKTKLKDTNHGWFPYVEPAHDRFVDTFRTEDQR